MADPIELARAFDELAGDYDNPHHDEVATALLEFVAAAPGGAVPGGAVPGGAVRCGHRRTGRRGGRRGVRDRGGGPRGRPEPPGRLRPVLAVDISAGMVAAGRARAKESGLVDAIDWRVGPAVPLPVADASLDVVLCASSLHFLGARALADWRRVLRTGGRPGFTPPVASGFRPSGTFAGLVAPDLRLPRTAADACELARVAGFPDGHARVITVGSREVVLVTARRGA